MANAGWKDCTFDQFIKLNRGFDLPNEKIIDGVYPVVASTSIKAFHKVAKVKGPGVVTGRSGSLGAVQYIQGDYWPLNTALYVKDFKGNYPQFVYYFLQCMRLDNFNSGAGVPTLNQNHLHKLSIRIPNVSFQQKIASILSAYDDLIENNKCRIAILEKMAEEIYREWFVRMRFLSFAKATEDKTARKRNRGLPDGWQIERLDVFCKRVTDGTHDTPKPKGDGFPLVTGKNLIGGRIDFTDTYKISEEDHINISKRSGLSPWDILFSNIGTLGSMALVTKNISYSVKNIIIFKSKCPAHALYLYYTLRQKNHIDLMQAISSGASQQFISLGVARGYQIINPGNELIEKFAKVAIPIQENINNLYETSDNLQKTRDLLLPRLISGKLSAENLEFNSSEDLHGIEFQEAINA